MKPRKTRKYERLKRTWRRKSGLLYVMRVSGGKDKERGGKEVCEEMTEHMIANKDESPQIEETQ
jgi:hypothetical protein